MTAKLAKARQDETERVALKYETATAIRALLDKARQKYGAEDWDDGDLETTVIELATEER